MTDKDRGVTLTELAVAFLISVAVLAVTGMIVANTVRAWIRGESMAGVQRSAAFAVSMMERDARMGRQMDFSDDGTKVEIKNIGEEELEVTGGFEVVGEAFRAFLINNFVNVLPEVAVTEVSFSSYSEITASYHPNWVEINLLLNKDDGPDSRVISRIRNRVDF